MRIHQLCFMFLVYFPFMEIYAFAQTQDTIKENREGITRMVFEKFDLTEENGKLNFLWNVNNQHNCKYFEIEKSFNNKDFKVIALTFPFENNKDSVYKYFEHINKKEAKRKIFFRIRAQMNDSSPLYSDIIAHKIR